MNQYRKHVNNKFSLDLRNSQELQKWSTSDPQGFWIDLWSYVGIIPELPAGTTRAYDPTIPMTQVPPFFEDARINYAENVLTQPEVRADAPALIGLREGQGLDGERWTWTDLRENVRKIQSALLRSGIKEGDRVAALISTSIWSVAVFLAAASIGAIYSSIASDLGTEGCTSRLAQIRPAILFADSHVTYKGKQRSNLDKINAILEHLNKETIVVLIPLHETTSHTFVDLFDFLSRSSPSDSLQFKRLPFSAPLYILYSSGTSGPPKCLVHQHGVILQHKKVSKLHNSLKPGEVVFQYSSPSWVLWNIMVGHLSAGTTLVLYDGSPTFPQPQAMLDIVQRHNVSYWGLSPGYLQQLQSTGVMPKKQYQIPSLRMVQSGGAHLATNQYHWFYQAFPSTIHLTSVTGGTDLVTSWIGTDPAGPLYAGEIQLPMLGHDIDVADPVTGESIKHLGLPGEFICRQPFPSMPVFFWGDEGNKIYSASYFERFDFPCWSQHDWISFNPITGGSQVHGRSDGVLNPQGIRFGSSEVYSITEAHPFDKVIETTLCVGRRRKGLDSDESVFLFVIMRNGSRFDRDLELSLRDAIRTGLSARHVPRFVIPVKEIPMTVNGKKVETLVKQTICTGELPKSISSTVANAHCLEDFKRYYSIEESDVRAKL
ncbi:acetoacetate-CoA ligase [Thozetella sp. PMI_491]|nr:acetoacetate-CoA ligase [Thozetella sp. PMI_491]